MAVMTTPQTFAKGETAKIRMEAMINAEIVLQLADMASLRNQITFVGSVNGTGSDTIRYRTTDLGAKTPLATVGDGAALTSSSMDGSHADVVVARSGLSYALTDLFSMSGFGEDIDPFFVANAMAMAAEARINQIICATFDSATTSKGVSGAKVDMNGWLEELYALEIANNGGQLTNILHNKSFTDLQQALRTENNNFFAFHTSTAEMAAAKPQGYCGSLLGVDIFRSDFVQEDGGAVNYVNAMFSQGGIGYAVGSPEITGASSEFRPANTPLVVEFSREAKSGISEIVGHLYCGASILEDARVVKLIGVK